MVQSITLQNVADTDIVNNDILGQICFAAPNEATGTDALLVAASIFARSEGTFAADNNATELVFVTGASESAAPGATNYDMALNSTGTLSLAGGLVIADGGNIGSASDTDALTISSGGLVTFSQGFAVGSDASGDILYHNGTSYVKLAKGSDDEVLTLASGLPSWAAAGGGSARSVAGDTGNGVVTWVTGDNTFAVESTLIFDGTDLTLGNDLILDSDECAIQFGDNQEVTLTHVQDSGLTLKHTAGGDNKPLLFTLATGETTLIADEVLSKLAFQAPSEASGTDAILIAAAIQAVAEGAFNTSSNATRLEFMTGSSEAATTKMTLSSAGVLNVSGAITQGIATSAEDPEDDATLDIDLSDGNYFEVDLGANVTDIDFTKGAVGQRFVIRFQQHASSGPYTLAWDAVTHDLDGGGSPASVTVSWPGGTAPTMTATDDKADTYGFIVRAEAHFDGYVIGQNIAETTN